MRRAARPEGHRYHARGDATLVYDIDTDAMRMAKPRAQRRPGSGRSDNHDGEVYV